MTRTKKILRFISFFLLGLGLLNQVFVFYPASIHAKEVESGLTIQKFSYQASAPLENSMERIETETEEVEKSDRFLEPGLFDLQIIHYTQIERGLYKHLVFDYSLFSCIEIFMLLRQIII